MNNVTNLGRRTVLKSAGASLIIGLTIGSQRGFAAQTSGTLAPNAFIRIDADNTVRLVNRYIESGQGVTTGLAMIAAEELDADWAQMKVEAAPADVKAYANPILGVQGTGGSSSIAGSYTQLRNAAATARAMLVQAAAQEWKVPVAEITVTKGVIAHAASGHSSTFGPLVATAARLTPPATVTLKDDKAFTMIGQRLPHLETQQKVTGQIKYTLDVQMPGLLTAVIARPPRFGATVAKFDAANALKVPGVKHVLQIPSGVAVVADNFWAASRGRDALFVEWDSSKAEHRGTSEILAEYRKTAEKPGLPVRHEGDAAAAMKAAAKIVTADFELPYLAHAPMEPLGCVVKRSENGCELWFGSQFVTFDQANIARTLGLKPEQVTINILHAGGSFGRRASFYGDYALGAVEIAKALSVGTPIKMVFTREDEIRSGYYRPLFFHRIQAGLDAKGQVIAWTHTLVGQSIFSGTPFDAFVKDGIDVASVETASNVPYKIPNVAVDVHNAKNGIPVLWWRSVGSSHNGYVVEHFFDQIAQAAGRDPVAMRREMLPLDSRQRAVMELALEKSGWATPLPKGRARGVAVVESFGTAIAYVAEISQDKHKRIKVDRVVAAVDCGRAINPDQVEHQVESGIAFGLGAALYGEITLKDGQVEQGNFDTYNVLRMAEMPKVEVHILPSTANPTGLGEPPVPPIGPAVANAILALTGKPVTKLPIYKQPVVA
jgi:isoquinoline 1-oxidoreductase beta subunit